MEDAAVGRASPLHQIHQRGRGHATGHRPLSGVCVGAGSTLAVFLCCSIQSVVTGYEIHIKDFKYVIITYVIL